MNRATLFTTTCRYHIQLTVFTLITAALFFNFCSNPVQAQTLTDRQQCIMDIFADAPATMTLGEARSQCEKTSFISTTTEDDLTDDQTSLVQDRIHSDEDNILKPFSLMAHEPNYLLAGAYNFQGWSSSVYEQASSRDISFDNTEIQFQLSIKTPLAVDLFDKDIGIFAAYTMRSFWQAYNSDISSPFRETNHQPEMWIQSEHDWELFGIKNSLNMLGMVHQSNGQSGQLSRSWNRIYAGFLLEKNSFALYLKPWIRLSESESSDDNPDITDYLGHGEISLAYKRDDHVFTLMSRNNLESGFSKGAVEIGWSFPLFSYDYIKGYIQYFSGYGESLIDYDNYVNRIGVGVLLTDVL